MASAPTQYGNKGLTPEQYKAQAEALNAVLRELHANGMSDAEIGDAMGTTADAAKSRRKKLRLRANRSNAASGGKKSQHISRPRTAHAAQRRCLCCGGSFHSAGPGNRICNRCKGTESFRGAEWLP